MAKLNELKLRTQSIIRKQINNKTYLLWANEALEQLSEIAKVEVKPIEPILNDGDYDYIITKSGLEHATRKVTGTYSVNEKIYTTSVGEPVAEKPAEEFITSEQPQIVGTKFFNIITVTDTYDDTKENVAPPIEVSNWV